MSELRVTESDLIPGFYVIDQVLHEDNRGWFEESYQKDKMEALGLPEFTIVQNNVSFNNDTGVTRGLHAEPWEKFITVLHGRVFGAWVDLRAGESFGRKFSLEIAPGTAVFVPRGVANGYQTLEEHTVYSYLVNEHWSQDAQYTFVNLFDPEVGISWPIPEEQTITSDKDKAHPLLKDVVAVEPANE